MECSLLQTLVAVHAGKAVGEGERQKLSRPVQVVSALTSVQSSSTCRPVPYVCFLTIIGHMEYTEEVLSDGLATMGIFGKVACSVYACQLKTYT